MNWVRLVTIEGRIVTFIVTTNQIQRLALNSLNRQIEY